MCYCYGVKEHILPYCPKQKSTHKDQWYVNIGMQNMQGTADDTAAETVNYNNKSIISSTSHRSDG